MEKQTVEFPLAMREYLKGKDLVEVVDNHRSYEAFRKEQIEEQIQLALKNGFTMEQKEKFKRHIAQICKYYVYEDKWFEKNISYGKSMRECADLVMNFMEKKDTM